MKKVLTFVFAGLLATSAFAQKAPDIAPGNNPHSMAVRGWARPGGGGSSNLVDHGGPVIVTPTVVCIFWGFASNDSYALAMQDFRNRGIKPYTAMLSQYRSAGTGAAANMGGSANDKFDTVTPVPLNVTDADVQAEVKRMFGGHEDPNAIYEVFIPGSSYSSSGSSTSCGGPNLAYCAYHSNFNDGTINVKYSIEPAPNCSGCQTSGFTYNQNAEHFMIHETRETISDADGNAWYDSRGNEADDKCAWTPTPFVDQSTGFAYQYEWSNSSAGCVQR